MTNLWQEMEQPAVRCVDRAIRVLKLLSEFDAGVDLGVIAKQSRLPKSTLVRILRTMCQRGIVQQDERTHHYRLGISLLPLARAARRQTNIPELVQPYLAELAESTGETASYAVLAGSHATYVTQALSSRIIRGVPPIDASLELPCTAVGKVLLTSFDRAHLDEFLRTHALRKHTHKTVANTERLRKELAQIGRQGYAFDDEEVELGKRCIAAPILDSHGMIIAAISITGPTERIRLQRVACYAHAVMEMARRISSALSAMGIGT